MGWRCTRDAGHDGPCAAVPVPGAWPIAENKEQLEALSMQEIRDMEKMAALKKIAEEFPPKPPTEFEQAMQLKREQELKDKCAHLEQRIAQERAKQHGVTVEPERTCVTCAPTRTDAHYAELGKLRWSIRSNLEAVRAKRFVFGADQERRDIALAMTHIEDALFRLDRVIDNGAQQ